ncbi:MAG TPA: hypothetical protein VI197_16915 [Polyangiaceae bacterium]
MRYSRHDRQVALTALDEFVEGPGWREIEQDAFDEFWQGIDPDETAAADDERIAVMSEQVFDWWLFFDFQYEPQRRVVDAFLEVTSNLSVGARAYLELARSTKLWLYQVTDVHPGQGMTLRDVVTGEEQRVVERSGSRELRRWTIIATRIMPAERVGDPVLDGGVLIVSPMRAERLVEWLKEMASEQSANPLALEHIGPELHAAWIKPFEMPNLVNYDGDPMVMAKVYFDVEDPPELITLLDGTKRLDRVEDPGDPPRWSWCGKGKDRKEPVIFGWFSLADARLVFETNSAERAERGRKLVERVAGHVVRYRVTQTEDMAQAMAAARERDSSAPHEGRASGENLLPPELREVGNVAAEQYLNDYYEQWLDDAIPRLDGMTPREAARANDPRMVEMLKELETTYEQALASGQPAFDPTWMWEELGLSDARDAPKFRKGAPVLGHESLGRHLPELPKLAQETAHRVRRQAGSRELTRVVSSDDLVSDLGYQRFARACPSAEFAEHAATTLINFELHLRKVFWVGESLSWMLGATSLDVTGEAVRPPFRSLALVFTDRYALGLAERVNSRLPADLRRGRMLQVLTVYVTERHADETTSGRRTLDLACFGDVLDGTLPSIVPCRLELDDEARLSQILQAASPGVASIDDDDSVRPIYESTPLRDLLALVVNALLYATSQDADQRELPPSPQRASKTPHSPPSILSSETVFHLPWHHRYQDPRAHQESSPRWPQTRALRPLCGARSLASRQPHVGGPTTPLDQAPLERPQRRRHRRAPIPPGRMSCSPRIGQPSVQLGSPCLFPQNVGQRLCSKKW